MIWGDMSKVDYCVVGHFSSLEKARMAITALRADGYDRALESYSPFPEHSLEEAMYSGKKRSPVRRATLLGGLCGCFGAFLMTCWMSVDYPLRVSAKPLISIPSFVIIGFECTILLGGIITLLAMFHFSRIPNLFPSAGYRKEFSAGTFGLVLRVEKEKSDTARLKMESLGADQVEVEYVR